MSINIDKLGNFLKRKAATQVKKATGIDIMHMQYTANAMGVSSKPQAPAHGQTGHVVNLPGAAASRPHSEPVLGEEHPRRLISTVEDFLGQRESMALTPHGGAVMLLHALLNFSQPATRQAGLQMLVLSMWEESLVPGSTYKTYALCPADQQRLESVQAPNDAVLRSYVSGTSPEHGYWFKQEEVGVRFQPGPFTPDAGVVQLLLWSSGAGAPRPVTMRKNKKGYWKVLDFSALLAPVQPSATPLHTAADDL